MVKVHAVIDIETLEQIITNIKKRGFGKKNIESGKATAVLDFYLPDGSEMLSLLNRGEWSALVRERLWREKHENDR